MRNNYWTDAAIFWMILALLALPMLSEGGSTVVRDRNGRIIEQRSHRGGSTEVRDSNGRLKETWTVLGKTRYVRDGNGRLLRVEKIR